MNKQYKLTDSSKFTTVMKAAAEYGIEISTVASTSRISIWYSIDDGRKQVAYSNIDECSVKIQRIIDEIKNYRRIQEEGGDYQEGGENVL
ncbi:MAG: hypothetical protein IKJ78_04180 [Bacteroidales bacterium]|nr:hypothetical protein [Bacteroidales bacterium]